MEAKIVSTQLLVQRPKHIFTTSSALDIHAVQCRKAQTDHNPIMKTAASTTMLRPKAAASKS